MAEHVNIKSYEGVENFATFSKEAFKEYCSTKLLTCNKHINFIKKNNDYKSSSFMSHFFDTVW